MIKKISKFNLTFGWGWIPKIDYEIVVYDSELSKCFRMTVKIEQFLDNQMVSDEELKQLMPLYSSKLQEASDLYHRKNCSRLNGASKEVKEKLEMSLSEMQDSIKELEVQIADKLQTLIADNFDLILIGETDDYSYWFYGGCLWRSDREYKKEEIKHFVKKSVAQSRAKDKVIIKAGGVSKGNPGPSGIGFVMYNQAGDIVTKYKKHITVEITNNVAEYLAVIVALEIAKKRGFKTVKLQSDSQLAVNQINGKYRAKDPKMAKLLKYVKEKMSEFNSVSVRHIPRKENQFADRLASEAVDEYLSNSANENTQKKNCR